MEAGTHGVDVVGIFFFDDNVWALRKGDPIGERLAAVSKQTGTLLMACDNCALQRNLAKGEPRWCDPTTGGGRAEAAVCEPVEWSKAPTSPRPCDQGHCLTETRYRIDETEH